MGFDTAASSPRSQAERTESPTVMWRAMGRREWSKHPLNAVAGAMAAVAALHGVYVLAYGWMVWAPTEALGVDAESTALYAAFIALSTALIGAVVLRFRWTAWIAAAHCAAVTVWTFLRPVEEPYLSNALVAEAAVIVANAAIMVYLFVGVRPNIMFQRRVFA